MQNPATYGTLVSTHICMHALQADCYVRQVDEDTYDTTDYTVQVTGLPPDAGVHEVGGQVTKKLTTVGHCMRWVGRSRMSSPLPARV